MWARSVAGRGRRKLKRNVRKTIHPMSVSKWPGCAVCLLMLLLSPKQHQTEPACYTTEKESRKKVRKRKLKSGGNALLTEMEAPSPNDLFGEGRRRVARSTLVWVFVGQERILGTGLCAESWVECCAFVFLGNCTVGKREVLLRQQIAALSTEELQLESEGCGAFLLSKSI